MIEQFIEVRYVKARTQSALQFLDTLQLGCLTPRVKRTKLPPRTPLVQYEFIPPATLIEKKESKKK